MSTAQQAERSDGRGRGRPQAEVDILLVSLGSTAGLRLADEQLYDALVRAGASVALARAQPPREVRTLMLTDLVWARAARAAARAAPVARATIYSTTTAALLWPLPGAIRFDALSAANRPGRHGLWQRPLERRRLAAAPLLLPWSQGARAELPATLARRPALVLPVSVEPSGPPAATRDVAAVTYGANPRKKGLARVIAAWRQLRGEASPEPAGELVVCGIDAAALERALPGALAEPGVRCAGMLGREEYRALLRRARAFVCAPAREDYGIAQLEALADGCMLVTTPAPGPYAALEIARALDSRLVSDDLTGALHAALSAPLEGYSARALAALAPFREDAVRRAVRGQLLPLLLGERAQRGE